LLWDPDGVEGDVNAPRSPRDCLGVLLDGPLVEGVDLGRLYYAPRGGDLPGHRVDLVNGATGEEDPRSFPGEGAGHGAAYGPPPP
jgi:hypothetical protein